MLQILQVLEIKDLAPAGGSVMGVPQLDGNSHRRLVAHRKLGKAFISTSCTSRASSRGHQPTAVAAMERMNCGRVSRRKHGWETPYKMQILMGNHL